ncbi:MAG: hypothetical protein U0414_22715 [Polyangiaceae bacterium]
MSAPLRERLGIPHDARRVLVFTESSHWDARAKGTSEARACGRVDAIFGEILRALEADRRRVYGIESVFFLRHHWEQHPESRARLRALLEPDAQTGRPRLRLLSAALTTPDTLTPHPESLFRDFLLGQEWLRREGLTVYPTTAYFPDHAGHSPHLPSLMRAVGVSAVGLGRIEGTRLVSSRARGALDAPPHAVPPPRVLGNELEVLDFVWRDDDGAELLCHWNAFTYFQGDSVASAGRIRWNDRVFDVPWRTSSHVRRRIDGYVRSLAPRSRTPYLLCPIGMDFTGPIPDLTGLLDRYNHESYPTTGTWTILAGLDDYFALLEPQRAELPILSIDPTPEGMGQDAFEPSFTRRAVRVARALVLAEKLSATAEASAPVEAALAAGWQSLVRTNHHGSVIDASTDEGGPDERRGWLERAESSAALALSRARAPRAIPRSRARTADVPRCERTADGVIVSTERLRLTFSKAVGGVLTSLRVDDREQLDGFGLDLAAHSDLGGFSRWDAAGGVPGFDVIDRTSFRPAELELLEREGEIVVVARAKLDDRPFVRRCVVRGGDPFIRFSVEGAPRRGAITARLELVDALASLEMDTLGGRVERPRGRAEKASFWPVPSLVTVRSGREALHAAFESMTRVAFSAAHELEWIVARTPATPGALGILPARSPPLGDPREAVQEHRATLFATAGDGDPAVPPELHRQLELEWFAEELRDTHRVAHELVQCDDPGVTFAAIKRAEVGDGLIVRLACDAPKGQTAHVYVDGARVRGAFESDAREREGAALPIVDGRARVIVQRRVSTLRLHLLPTDDGSAPAPRA